MREGGQLVPQHLVRLRVRVRGRGRGRVRAGVRVRVRVRVTSASFGRRPGVSPGRKEPRDDAPSTETTEEVPLR